MPHANSSRESLEAVIDFSEGEDAPHSAASSIAVLHSPPSSIHNLSEDIATCPSSTSSSCSGRVDVFSLCPSLTPRHGSSAASSGHHSAVEILRGNSGDASFSRMINATTASPSSPRTRHDTTGSAASNWQASSRVSSGRASEDGSTKTQSMRAQVAALPATATRRFPPHPLTPDEEIEQLVEINDDLQQQLRKALAGKLDVLELIKENAAYKRKLDEVNAYIDQIDIEAEQEFGNLSEEIDQLSNLVEEKSNLISYLEQRQREKDREIASLKESLEGSKAATSRHIEVIETLRDELDMAREHNNDRALGSDRLAAELAAAKESAAAERETFRQKELLLICDLDDIQRQLNVQKDIIQSNGVRDIIERWDARIQALENELRERDSIIYTQQHLLNELRRTSPPAATGGKYGDVGGGSASDRNNAVSPHAHNSLSSVNSRSH